MKTDGKLKIVDLESDLFIEDLGKVRGGHADVTTYALGEEDSGSWGPGPADGPGYANDLYPELPAWIDNFVKHLF